MGEQSKRTEGGGENGCKRKDELYNRVRVEHLVQREWQNRQKSRIQLREYDPDESRAWLVSSIILDMLH